MKLDLKQMFLTAILAGIGLLLESCTPFRAREVDLDKRSEQESQVLARLSIAPEYERDDKPLGYL